MEDNRNLIKSIFSNPRRIFLPPHWYSYAAKRVMDVLASLTGLIVLAPFFLFLRVLIKRDTPGPVFFRGPRMGKGGRIFQILKFRTMREETASYDGPCITAEDDPRITPLGRWLRDTKVNELPQLWNVLIGEMSLVGPRPEVPEIVAKWPEAARIEILSMRPGITSPTSVAYHDEEGRLKAESVMDAYVENIQPDKLRLDQLYVRHHTFFGDLDTLFWTFVILIPRMKEKRIPEGWLFGGPISRVLRRYLGWTAVDFVTAFIVIGLLGILWRFEGPLDIGVWKSFEIAVGLALLFGFFNTLLGLKNVVWSRAAADDVLRLVVSCGLVTMTVIAMQFALYSKPYLPVDFMITAGLLVLAGFVAVRYRLRLITGLANRWINLRRSGYGAGERVLIVGAGEGSEFATWLYGRTDFRRHYSVIGIVDDNPAKQGMRFDGVKVLGTVADIPELVKHHDVDMLFYAISKISPADSQRILSFCKMTKLHLIRISDVYRTLHDSMTIGLPRQFGKFVRADSLIASSHAAGMTVEGERDDP